MNELFQNWLVYSDKRLGLWITPQHPVLNNPFTLSESDDEEKLLEIMVATAHGLHSKVNDRYEIRDRTGKVIHRIDIKPIYTVNPKD